MNRLAPSAAALVVLLVLSSCAAAGGPGPAESAEPSPDGGDHGGGHEIEHPTGADELVLLVESVGGFVPLEFSVTQLPSFSLYGDGRVVVQGMQTLEFPGPALPPLLERRLTPAGIQAILDAVEGTNLFGTSREFRGAMNVVADASDTVFTVHAGGREVTVSVYGLGTLSPDMGPPPQGIPAGEIEAHEALTALNERLLMIDEWLPAGSWATDGWHPYEPEAFRLYVRDVTGEPAEGGDLAGEVLRWPTDDDPAAFGEEQPFFGNGTRCGAVDGDAGLAWSEALRVAKQNARWTDDGERVFSVLPRPLLPHEEARCPALAGA